eukprot:c15566_g1_i4.p1 GENE.c15566_g1_i4~~c15566_g1_i4.p1  ORF type:complete len:210 (+),score=41.23 c15566_g1_i4:35-631(+)
MLTRKDIAVLRANDWPELQAMVHERPAIVHSTDEDGWTFLHFLAGSGDTHTVMFLLLHGADPNAQDESGWTTLHSAARRGHGEIVSLLLRSGALCNIINESGWTALMVAVNNNAIQVVKVLLEAGADLTTPNEQGRTARDVGVICEHEEAVAMIDQEVRRRKSERLRTFLIGTLRRRNSLVRMLPVDVLGVIASLVCL